MDRLEAMRDTTAATSRHATTGDGANTDGTNANGTAPATRERLPFAS
jgi:hypothetical protein